ncbi:hypothetical protein JI59_01485 [Novosphingobium pentaromativorans US6-1]|nr:hypothetical protein JI59_01485 [Novosphingobium pentaromativorans US6-1]
MRPLDVFPSLTPKQHEVLSYVAENRTSKEIAFEIGISVSAVNQRIESIRNRTGSPPRAELARAYRIFLQEQDKANAPDHAAQADGWQAAQESEAADNLPQENASDGDEAPAPRLAQPAVGAMTDVLPAARHHLPVEGHSHGPLVKGLTIVAGTVLVVLVALGIVLTLHRVL